jgi:branched-chain amino acid transport system substrate-binding protein
VQPYWLDQVGCNLPVKPDHRQYTPSSLPSKS